MSITKKELQTSHDYWVANFNEKAESIDKLCVKSAERINVINFKLTKRAAFMSHETHTALCTETYVLESILVHFHGFLDKEYVKGHDLTGDFG